MNEFSNELIYFYQFKLKTSHNTMSKPRQKCIHTTSEPNTADGEKLGAKLCPAPACASRPGTGVCSPGVVK